MLSNIEVDKNSCRENALCANCSYDEKPAYIIISHRDSEVQGVSIQSTQGYTIVAYDKNNMPDAIRSVCSAALISRKLTCC
jgi:hypothetical protein